MPKEAEISAPKRLVSLDAMRGLIMLGILFFNKFAHALASAFPNQSWLQKIAEQFTHPEWEGFRVYDLIFPAFEFMIGMSVYLSLQKRLDAGTPRAAIVRSALIRVGIMVFLGMCVNGNLLTFSPENFRLSYSVLQMLAVAYLIAVIAMINFKLRGQLILFFVLLVGYWAILTFVPLPSEPRVYTGWQGKEVHALAHEMGVYKNGSMVSYWLDEKVFGENDFWKVGWILQSMAHGCSALLGIFAAVMIRRCSPKKGIVWLFASGVTCLVAGWLWSFQFPIIKNMWSSTFVLWAGGWTFLLLALMCFLFDHLKWSKYALPLQVVGANSIVAYLLATLFSPVIWAATRIFTSGLGQYVGGLKPVVDALTFGVIAWGILYHLYRMKCFVRL